jgi:hypothetical protein
VVAIAMLFVNQPEEKKKEFIKGNKNLTVQLGREFLSKYPIVFTNALMSPCIS